MKKQKTPVTGKDIFKCVLWSALYIAFLVWSHSWWGFLFLPLIIDLYITRFINWGWWKDIENPVTRTIMSWLDAIVFALVAVYFVNIYFFQNYVIPSSSQETSLLVGDYLFVSKPSYGVRTPMTPLSLPLTQHTLPLFNCKSYFDKPQWKYERIHASRVPLTDIVVFNYPAGDTVALNFQNQDYYSIAYELGHQYLDSKGITLTDGMTAVQKRNYFAEMKRIGEEYISANPQEFGQVVARPVDRRENYVKRCVGTPGQTLEIRDRIIYLDGKANKEPDNVQYNYLVELKDTQLPEDFVKQIGLSREDETSLYRSGICPLPAKMAEQMRARTDIITNIEPAKYGAGEFLYPQNGGYGWTCDNYGPVWIPAKGESIDLTLENLPLYERPIAVYEGNQLEVTPDGIIKINGKEAHSYTFKMDYYWMMGDNRHNSADSRYWGFVPEDHIVGKPVMIWFSRDADYGLFHGGIRWNRLFSWVEGYK